MDFKCIVAEKQTKLRFNTMQWQNERLVNLYSIEKVNAVIKTHLHLPENMPEYLPDNSGQYGMLLKTNAACHSNIDKQDFKN